MRLFIRIFSLLPLSVLYHIADLLLYPLIYYVARYRLKVVRQNLQASFPEKLADERLQLEREFYHHFADMLVEIVYGYRISDEEMRQRVVFENVELVEDFAHQTHGVVVYLGHMGNWEWIADLQKRFADKNMVEYNVYRQLKNPRSDQMMRELRAKRGGECVEKNQLLRKLVSLRKANHSYMLAMLADQKPSKRSTYAWTTFLHRETAFLNGGELLAKKFGLSAIYAHILSPKRGYYTIRFEAITADPNTMSEDQITRKYAQLLEQNIQQQPSQWLWTHNRWKWGRKELEG